MSRLQAEAVREAIGEIVKDAKDKTKKGSKLVQTVELQIGLKNYDPQKDKRFQGSIKLANPTKSKFKVCVLGDDKHCDQAKALGVDFLDVKD